MLRRKKNFKKIKKPSVNESSRKKPGRHFYLPHGAKRLIFGVLFFLLAIIIIFSFFHSAGIAGEILMKFSVKIIGKTVFLLPLFFILGGLVFFLNSEISRYRTGTVAAGLFILITSVSGILGAYSIYSGEQDIKNLVSAGGWLGYIVSLPILKLFGFWLAETIFLFLFTIGAIIIFQFLKPPKTITKEEGKEEIEIMEEKPSFIRKIFQPKFEIKEVPLSSAEEKMKQPSSEEAESKKPFFSEFKTLPTGDVPKGHKTADFPLKTMSYQPPPLNLLEIDRGMPTSGDIRINSAIIKKTLQNFDIPVEMSEINIGPTVTQYTLKPADGIKLSRITGLSNDLALSLSARSIRIEAPIPGRPLVGIEVPNKARTMVRLRNLLENPAFQNSQSELVFALGRDVAGNAVFADLSRMPHLLVAGSTGTGKTICLNTIILSLLYRNSPDVLKFILIDPKRVEFAVYNELPHLLAPVIFDAQKAVNALKWLIGEMERRFEVLSFYKARDIAGYNETIASKAKADSDYLEPLPYIVLIVDELADLMAARGREIEAGIVRLAQMARAVGIHLLVATQRPSVEVITGLIKANITSRITFQVASQVDSRTVLDAAGAEKLLGLGDMLFVSAEIIKPKRLQGAYVSEKEVKKVVNFLKKQKTESEKEELKIRGVEQFHGEDIREESPIREAEAGETTKGLEIPFSVERLRGPKKIKVVDEGELETIKNEKEKDIILEKEEEMEDEPVSRREAEPAPRKDVAQCRTAATLEEALNGGEEHETFSFEEDPLYEEAKKVVIEARKASASFLQRRLRLGYARAARLLDILEERGVVGPGEGAKPREVYLPQGEEKEEEGWKKI